MKKSYSIKYIMLFMLLVSLLVGFTACGEKQSGKSYEIYFGNSTNNKLVKKNFKSEQTESSELVGILLEQMNTKQKDKDYVVLKPDDLTVEFQGISEGVAVLVFNDAYYEMKTSAEVLYRSAVVQELCQIDGIEWVRFMIGDKDAVYADGNIIGKMNRDTFANDSDENIGNVEWKTINLYYANKTGDKLIKSETSVAYSKNISLEKIVVEKLIKGPSNGGNYATLPADMRLLSVSVNNRICYVNLSSEFISEMVNVSAMLPVYSIVNSLCDLDTVDGVKILINGNSTKTYRESINLDTIFYYNDTLL